MATTFRQPLQEVPRSALSLVRGWGRRWFSYPPPESPGRSVAPSWTGQDTAGPPDPRVPKETRPRSPQAINTSGALPGRQRSSDPFLSYRLGCYSGQGEDMEAQSREVICAGPHSRGVAELGQQSKAARALQESH